MRRVILHVDLDAFFCAVEELRDPSLRGKAFAVAGRPDQRGVVSSASYPARKRGVRSAMPTAQALRLCPGLIVVAHSHGIYGEHSDRVMNTLRTYANEIQQISVDEAFLDLTGFPGEPRALGLEIQRRIRDDTLLPASVGVATSKLVAKMASGRAKPNGVLVIDEGQEAAFMAPMAIEELWGIGSATGERLRAIGIDTIGALADATPEALRPVFGAHAAGVIERAQGIDASPVHAERDVKSISEERTYAQDVSDPTVLRKTLLSLSDDVAARLRASGYFARTIQLKLRWHDFKTITRQTTLATPTHLGDDIFAAIETLWRSAWRDGERVRLLGVGASGLAEGVQPTLFDPGGSNEREDLARALDALREQYGRGIVKRASLTRKRP